MSNRFEKHLNLESEIIKKIEKAQRLLEETEKMLEQKEIDHHKKLIILKRIHDRILQRIPKEKDTQKKKNLEKIVKNIENDLATTGLKVIID